MPIQYTSIIKEHHAARTHAALFDTCHMGEFIIEGSSSLEDLEKIITFDVSVMGIGQCKYGMMCDEKGGVVDDLVLYRLSEKSFMLVANASTIESDFQWLMSHCSQTTTVRNISDSTAKLDLQGPASPRIMQSVVRNLSDPGYYHFTYVDFHGRKLIVSRTGYTGEIGFEIYSSPDEALELWDVFISRGAVPAGLGARDTLRLEMGMPLYGHELSRERNAAESGFTRIFSPHKKFIGSEVIMNPSFMRQKLCGIELEGRRAARNGDTIGTLDSKSIGTITSGSFAPSLGKAIAMGYVNTAECYTGNKVIIRTARDILNGIITEMPFYKNATGRRLMVEFL